MLSFFSDFIIGIVAGLISAVVYDYLLKQMKYSFMKELEHLNSLGENEYDWVCYDMRKDNGRLRQDSPNGSIMNVMILKDNKIKISLKHDNGQREWRGELLMENKIFGTLTCGYINPFEHEFRFIKVFISEEIENGLSYDTIFLVDATDKTVYGNELARRVRQ
jgi:hypothetical protein